MTCAPGDAAPGRAQLVELQDAQPHALPAGKATADLYKCARAPPPQLASAADMRRASAPVLPATVSRAVSSDAACLPAWKLPKRLQPDGG